MRRAPRVTLLARLGSMPAGPAQFVDTGPWQDDVDRMLALVERLRDRAPGIEWRPLGSAGLIGHALTWTEGGEQRDHTENLLGELCEWADRRWPA